MGAPDTPAAGTATRQRIVGVSALAVAQGVDAATTLYGLRLPGVVERNPIAVAAMDWLGRLPGLAALLGTSFIAIVLVTESTVRYCRGGGLSPGRIRALGYGPPVALSGAAAANNLAVVGLF